MQTARAAALVATAGLLVASLSTAATAAVPSEEQPVGSTRLVSTQPRFWDSREVFLRDPDVSDSAGLVTFGGSKVGADPLFLRRPDMTRPTYYPKDSRDVTYPEAVVAPDGSLVAFVKGEGISQVVLIDTRTEVTTLIGTPDDPNEWYEGGNDEPSVSPDSRFVVFRSALPSLAPDGRIELGLYVYEVATREITAVDAGVGRRVFTQDPAVSSRGRYVAFTSAEPLVEGDTEGTEDVFRYDAVTHDIARVSGGPGPVRLPGVDSVEPQISADGSRICYTSRTKAVPSSIAPVYDEIHLTDMSTGVTQLVSRARDGGRSNGDSAACDISADGELVAFSSKASDLVDADTNGKPDIFVTVTATEATALVSRSPDGHAANDGSQQPAISADGRYVTYVSRASNLAAQDRDRWKDIFLTRLS